MIWKEDNMNSLGGLPREVQEEIMNIQDTNHSSGSAKHEKGRILRSMKHFFEKLNLIFNKRPRAKA